MGEVKAEVTGACSAAEQSALADPATTGQKANDCGTKAFNVITGKFDHDKFNSCFTASAGISTGCSECYAVSREYGAANCKADCLLGWCKSGCLSCTEPAQKTLSTCTGFTTPTADPCEEEVKAEVTGACSAAEQSALADPATTGQKANDCGTKAFNVITGKFDHDKFNSCSPRRPAFRPVAPSATPCLANTVPRIARPTACLVGASLAAFPAPSLRRRPSPLALVSPPPVLTLANRK